VASLLPIAAYRATLAETLDRIVLSMRHVPSKDSGLSIGITYAGAFAIYGIFFPFIPLIVRAKGLSDAEAGLALSAAGLAAMVGPVFFAHIADRKLQFRYLMPILLMLGALVVGLLDMSHTVVSAFFVIFLLYLFLIPAVSLLDSFTMDFVIRGQREGRKRSFQDYRIWGSIGFMLPSVALALWFSAHLVNVELLVVMSIATMVVCAVSALFLPANEPVQNDANLPSKEAFQCAIRPPLRTFFMANFFSGLALGVYYILFPRFLQELGCSIVEVGLIINAGVLCEVILMPFGRRLIDRFGLEVVMLMGYATIPVRMLIMVLFPSIPVMVAVQLLHAPLALGVFVSTPIFLQQRADPSFRHSLQSLNSALVLGFTRFCGPLIASIVMGISAGQPAIDGLSRALAVTGVLGLVSTIIFYQVYREGKASNPIKLS